MRWLYSSCREQTSQQDRGGEEDGGEEGGQVQPQGTGLSEYTHTIQLYTFCSYVCYRPRGSFQSIITGWRSWHHHSNHIKYLIVNT